MSERNIELIRNGIDAFNAGTSTRPWARYAMT
jgi:hypothetical protein